MNDMTYPLKPARRGWGNDAICVGADDLFFAPDGETRSEATYRTNAAKTFCHSCPVRRDCFAASFEPRLSGDPDSQYFITGPAEGIWGGATQQERKEWLRQNEGSDTLFDMIDAEAN